MLKFTFVVITSVPLELQRVLTTCFEGLNELYKLCLGPKCLNGIFIMQFWCAQMSKLSKYCQHSISKSKPKLAWVPVNYCYTQQNWMNDTKFSQIRETFCYKLFWIYGPLLYQGLRVQRSIRNGVLERATVFCRLRRSEAVNRQADFRIFISGFELGYVVNFVQIDQN